MERAERVLKEQQSLRAQAYDRWKAFQPDVPKIASAFTNRDGTVPRPRVGVITPEQRTRFQAREHARTIFDSTAYRTLRVTTERMIGATLDFADLPPNEQALKAGRPVVRLVTLGAPGIVPQGFATGFLVHPFLLITNCHVFRTPDEAEGVAAQFLYEQTHEGLREGLIFRLDPDRFFINHKGLDYAVVALKTTSTSGAPLSQFKYLPLVGAMGKIQKGDPVNIIQHPSGQPKQYATVNNRLLDLRDDGFLLYETDTLEGSSGAPVFNQHWETIGLHHCGVPQIEDNQLVKKNGDRVPLDSEVADTDLVWVANEGIRVSALVASFADQRLDNADQQRILEELYAKTLDPLRLVAEKSPVVIGTPTVTDVSTMLASETPMAQNIFQFSGPVTIQIERTTPTLAVPPVEATPAVVSPPAETFREKTLRFDERYDKRENLGYNADWLEGWSIRTPTVDDTHDGPLLEKDGEVWVIPYYHYSLVMNTKRRLLAWAASNVDYSDAGRKLTKTRKAYGGENWRLDPRVTIAAPGLQLEDADFYQPARKIDRGHIVRREDGAWGKSVREAEFGNSDTYHWTNCTPQSEAFNQSGKSGIWGQFEEHIQAEVAAEGGRMSIFAGPVLNPEDPAPQNDQGDTIQVPMEYWKVVMCVSREQGQRVERAYGFVFDQTEPIKRLGYGFERMNMDDYQICQMPIAEISKKTGVVFDSSVLAADVLKGGGTNESIRGFAAKRIHDLRQVVLR